MSHFSTIKTQLKEAKPLIKAIKHLGYEIKQEKKFIKTVELKKLLKDFMEIHVMMPQKISKKLLVK